MKMLVTIAALAVLLTGAAQAQTYVGDSACSGCHANAPTAGFFDGYKNSGHPWKLFKVGGVEPPSDTWPNTPVPPLPSVSGSQLLWSDVEYVIGNFFWKTRYMRRDGYIYTGESNDLTQWNIATQEFVPYNAGTVDKPFDCGRCHTTGYDPAGNQGGLPGIVGTWTEEGVRCEACHGPASSHASSPIGNPPPGGKDCSECHYRDDSFRMPWKGGFMRHHQQAEDLSHSPHSALSCTSCHNPHRSVVYDDGGVIIDCSTCHPGDASNNFYVVTGMESVTCTDCHMPKMAKSALAVNASKGDVSGHLFQIMTAPTAAADNVTDIGGSLYWNQDGMGESFITLDYACNGCHIELGTELSLSEASMWAMQIHSVGIPTAIKLFEADIEEGGVHLSLEVSTDVPSQVEAIVHRGTSPNLEYAIALTPQPIPFAGQQLSYLDEYVTPGASYWYWIEVLEGGRTAVFAGPIPVTIAPSAVTVTFAAPAQPNPASGSTVIQYAVGNDISAGAEVRVSITIFDSRGRLVRNLVNAEQSVGQYNARWDTRDESGNRVPPGVYHYTFNAGSFSHRSSLVVLK